MGKPFLTLLLLLGMPMLPVHAGSMNSGTMSAERTPVVRAAGETPSSFPVPRFVSLKHGKANCRIGPSLDHPVRVTYRQVGMPLLVTAETTDHWRRVEDVDGDQCWMHRTLLAGREMAIVTAETLDVQSKPNKDAKVRAVIGRGVLVRVHRCASDWCQVSVQRKKGWIPQSGVWGHTATPLPEAEPVR